MHRKIIIRDASVFSFNYVPPYLPRREKEMRKIENLFRGVLDGGISQSIFITGPVGTGKSVVAKRFCMNVKNKKIDGNRAIDYAIVNCYRRNTPDAVLLKILNNYQPNFPDRGFSVAEKLEIIGKHLRDKKLHLIVILDEVTTLISKSGSSLIYLLTRFDEDFNLPYSSLSLILISQKSIWESLDEATISSFKRGNIIKFNKYNSEELFDIVKQRVELGIYDGVIDDECISLIADIAAEYGDARYAIEILERAAYAAEEELSEVITPEHIRASKAEIHKTLSEEDFESLHTHHLLVLLSAARILKKKSYTTTGELEKEYTVVCEEWNEKRRGHTQFWKYIKELDAYDIISSRAERRGDKGTTTLISMENLVASEVEDFVVGMLRGRKNKKK